MAHESERLQGDEGDLLGEPVTRSVPMRSSSASIRPLLRSSAAAAESSSKYPLATRKSLVPGGADVLQTPAAREAADDSLVQGHPRRKKSTGSLDGLTDGDMPPNLFLAHRALEASNEDSPGKRMKRKPPVSIVPPRGSAASSFSQTRPSPQAAQAAAKQVVARQASASASVRRVVVAAAAGGGPPPGAQAEATDQVGLRQRKSNSSLASASPSPASKSVSSRRSPASTTPHSDSAPGFFLNKVTSKTAPAEKPSGKKSLITEDGERTPSFQEEIGTTLSSVSSFLKSKLPEKSKRPSSAGRKTTGADSRPVGGAQKGALVLKAIRDVGACAMSSFAAQPHVPEDPMQKLMQDIINQQPCAMTAFRAALESGAQQLRTVKLCFVGHARAGKTSTLLALAGRDFNPSQPSTHGVATCSLTHELLETSTTPCAPWGTLKDGLSSVADILERRVARCAAEHMRRASTDAKEGLGDHAGEMPFGGPVAGIPVREIKPELVRMPVDLIVKALSGDAIDEEQPIVMQTWDFAGQDLYYSMAHVFLTALGVYALCLDLSAWAKCWREGRAESHPVELTDSVDFWLAAILVHAPDARVVIVGTHDDEVPDEARASVRAQVNEYLTRRLENMPVLHGRLHVNEADQLLFFPVDNSRTSPDGQRSVDRLREAVNEEALGAVEDLGDIPSSWVHFLHVLTEIGAAPERPTPYITLEECACLAKPFKLGTSPQDLEHCLTFFHGLGQLLYFPKSPCVVLDPQWLLDAMAQVVACPRVLHQQSHRAWALRERGELSQELLDTLWASPRFIGHASILKTFLEHFDLLVPSVLGEHGETRWLVPALLPKRALVPGAAATGIGAEATLFLDFQGALRKLLPSLLLRLLCHLKSNTRDELRVFEVCQDFAVFSLGVKPLVVTVDMIPATAPTVMRVTMRGLPSTGSGAAVKDVLDIITKALLAWMPRLSFSAKLPCPACSCDVEQVARLNRGELGGHLLDLVEVLSTNVLFCPRALSTLEEMLPEFLHEWRRDESPPTPAPPPDADQDGDRGVRKVDLQFLYASPLAWSAQGVFLDQLNISEEVRALQCLRGLNADVRVATADALREVLVGGHCDILHLSAHCAVVPGVRAPTGEAEVLQTHLLLENECSEAHAITVDSLAKLGPWDRDAFLLVFLACGSEDMVRSLIKSSGLRRAVCCRGKVFDSAARLFCKAFYHALGSGHPVAACHNFAREALRGSPNRGFVSEAAKFVLLEADWPANGTPSMTSSTFNPRWPQWQQWSQVEDYVGRKREALQVASAFRQRRVLFLYGAGGVGKTAFCYDFCHHFTAPGGRIFSAGAFLLERNRLALCDADGDRAFRNAFARALLEDMRLRGALPGELGVLSTEEPWIALRRAAKSLDEAGKWLLVADGLVDGAEGADAAAVAATVAELLASCAQLRVLITARQRPGAESGWTALVSAKVVPFELAPLRPPVAAELFARRCRRALFPRDFSRTAPGQGDVGARPIGFSPDLCERLAASPLLHALGCLPGRLVEAAALVDCSLASLLEHPALPGAWRGDASAPAATEDGCESARSEEVRDDGRTP